MYSPYAVATHHSSLLVTLWLSTPFMQPQTRTVQQLTLGSCSSNRTHFVPIMADDTGQAVVKLVLLITGHPNLHTCTSECIVLYDACVCSYNAYDDHSTHTNW